MSDFNLFEAHEASGEDRRREAAKAGDKLAAAISDVRGRFGSFLFQASDRGDFEDRVALCKDDMIRAVDAHLMPVTGTMRRVVRAMRDDWERLAADSAASPGSIADMTSMGVADDTAQSLTGTGAYGAGIPDGVQGAGMTNGGYPVARRSRASDESVCHQKGHDWADDAHGGANCKRCGTTYAAQMARGGSRYASDDVLVPEGDFHGYLDDVAPQAESQAGENFVVTGPVNEHTGDPADTDFAKQSRRRSAGKCKECGEQVENVKGLRAGLCSLCNDIAMEWEMDDEVGEHHGSLRAAGTAEEQFRSRFKGIPTWQILKSYDPSNEDAGDETDDLFEELHYRAEEGDEEAAEAVLNDPDEYKQGRLAKGKGKGKGKAKKPKPQSEYGDAFDNMFGEPMGLLDDMIDSVKLRDRSKESRRRYVAGGDPLGQAAEAITQELQEQAEQFQQAIEPLQQALQAVDYAQQVQESQHPMNVQPGEGTVQVIPERNPVPQQIPQGGPEVMPEQAPLEDPNDPYGSQAAQAQQQVQARRRQMARGRRVSKSWTQNPDSPDWIGHHTDDELADNEAYWGGLGRADTSDEQAAAYLNLIRQEKGRRGKDARRRAYDRMAAEHRLEDVPSSEHPWGMTADEPPYPTHPYRGKGGDGLSWKPAKGDEPEHWVRPVNTELPNRRSKDSRRRGAGRLGEDDHVHRGRGRHRQEQGGGGRAGQGR